MQEYWGSNNIWKAIGKNFMMTASQSGETELQRLFAGLWLSLYIVRPVDLLSHFPTIFRYLSCTRRHALI